MAQSKTLGSEKISSLLIKQSMPAAMGVLVLSIYNLVDTIFVGNYVGPLGIAAVTVVMPITFFMSSVGMAIGIGGGSIISRALGSDNKEKAHLTFGNMIGMTLTIAAVFVIISSLYIEEVLIMFGGKGEILDYATEYFGILLIGIPFLAWAMMSNNIIRAEGKPKFAMLVMMIPAVSNIILDAVFIVYFKWGIMGAAWATTISYMLSAVYAFGFFALRQSELRLERKHFRIDLSIAREITSLGGVTLARQGTISLLVLVLNHTLFRYGGEISIAVYGIISRMIMFALFPVMGLVQGFVPIAGYNYGAEYWLRVKEVVNTAIKYGVGLSFIIFITVLLGADSIVRIFSKDAEILMETPYALRIAFLATPLIAVQLIGASYFQAIGKPGPALVLSLSKQGFFLIPLVLILPVFLGIDGVWIAFPIADLSSTLVTWLYLKKEINQRLDPLIQIQSAYS
ncbi:MAG: MATE family efflux transporter [Cyclobacteriaceae bacterium]|jgi:putative MATE family efflux protein